MLKEKRDKYRVDNNDTATTAGDDFFNQTRDTATTMSFKQSRPTVVEGMGGESVLERKIAHEAET